MCARASAGSGCRARNAICRHTSALATKHGVPHGQAQGHNLCGGAITVAAPPAPLGAADAAAPPAPAAAATDSRQPPDSSQPCRPPDTNSYLISWKPSLIMPCVVSCAARFSPIHNLVPPREVLGIWRLQKVSKGCKFIKKHGTHV